MTKKLITQVQSQTMDLQSPYRRWHLESETAQYISEDKMENMTFSSSHFTGSHSIHRPHHATFCDKNTGCPILLKGMWRHSFTFYDVWGAKIYLQQLISRQMLKAGNFLEIGTKPPTQAHKKWSVRILLLHLNCLYCTTLSSTKDHLLAPSWEQIFISTYHALRAQKYFISPHKHTLIRQIVYYPTLYMRTLEAHRNYIIC